MFISEPLPQFTAATAPQARQVPAGLAQLAAVLAVALTLLVVMLAVTPGITRICPAPRAHTPVHLAR
jgi:hypothetical protein